MGFHKRFITKYSVLENISDLDNLFDADALIMDDWSGKFSNDLNHEERKLREKIKEDQKYSSGCPDKHPDYPQLNSLSEALIGLMTNPTWLDIHFVQDKLGRFQLEIDEFGDFEKLKTKSIEAIVNHFNI
jgi:hypothetical protein